MSALRSFHFLYPAWLLVLVPLAAVFTWLVLQRSGEGSWAKVVDSALLPALRLEAGQQGSAPWRVCALLWTLAAVALAGPAWRHQESPAFRAPRDWIVLLDLSPSMSARDLTPDRATRARYVIDDLLSAAQDARLALIVFAGDAHAVTPLTSDVETVRALLKPLTPGIMPAAGDLLRPALEEAAMLLKSVASRDAQIIVLTDGFADPAQALRAAAAVRAQGAAIHVIGIGTPSGAPAPNDRGAFDRDEQGRTVLAKMPSDLLQRLAAAGGGDYVALSSERQLITTLQQRRTQTAASEKIAKVELDTWRNEGIWLLPPLLVLAAFIARRGWI